jgi:hypothetical protein
MSKYAVGRSPSERSTRPSFPVGTARDGRDRSGENPARGLSQPFDEFRALEESLIRSLAARLHDRRALARDGDVGRSLRAEVRRHEQFHLAAAATSRRRELHRGGVCGHRRP